MCPVVAGGEKAPDGFLSCGDDPLELSSLLSS